MRKHKTSSKNINNLLISAFLPMIFISFHLAPKVRPSRGLLNSDTWRYFQLKAFHAQNSIAVKISFIELFSVFVVVYAVVCFLEHIKANLRFQIEI